MKIYRKQNLIQHNGDHVRDIGTARESIQYSRENKLEKYFCVHIVINLICGQVNLGNYCTDCESGDLI